MAALAGGACLGVIAAASAHATDGAWLAAPASGEWTVGTNWTSSPAVPDGTAIFSQSTQTSIAVSSNAFIQTLQFTAGASSYTFNLSTSTLNITSGNANPGIIIDPASAAQTFNVSGSGQLAFFGSATAASGRIGVPPNTFAGVQINNNDTGLTTFFDMSTAGAALISNQDNAANAGTIFAGHSTAGSAGIINDNTLAIFGGTVFQEHSTAGNSNIRNQNFGQTLFKGNSDAGSATIRNIFIMGNATLAGATFFTEQSSASSASIVNLGGGFTRFTDNSTAGTANITNNPDPFGSGLAGLTEFRASSNAGSAIIDNNGGFVVFHDNSNAGNATIVNENGGTTQICDHAAAGNAMIFNQTGGSTTMCGNGSADAPAILNATIINNAGGSTFFKDMSTGGLVRLIANAGGAVDISGLSTAGTTAGSIEGAGTFFLGSKTFTVGLNNFSTEVSGIIADGGASGGSGGSLIKVGTGTLILSGVNTYGGPTTVNGGALVVNGSIVASSSLDVNSGGIIGGIGTLPTTRINAGGTLSPGNSIGTITVQGNLAFASAATYMVEVSSTSADRTNVTGTASLAGTVQATILSAGSTHSYTILSASGGRSGTFGALTTTGLPGFTAALSYTATDVVLNLTAALGSAGGPGGNGATVGLPQNQAAVANSLNTFFNNGGALPPSFANVFGLTGANLASALALLSASRRPARGRARSS